MFCYKCGNAGYHELDCSAYPLYCCRFCRRPEGLHSGGCFILSELGALWET